MARRAGRRGAVDLLPDVERGGLRRARPRRRQAGVRHDGRRRRDRRLRADRRRRRLDRSHARAGRQGWPRSTRTCASSTTSATASWAGRSRPASPPPAATSSCTPTPTCPFDMEEVPRAIRLMREYEVDIVSAYRFDRTGEGYTRAIYTFFYNGLIRTMFGVKARDINFAFKLCRRRGVRPHRAAERGLVHRRRAGHPGDQARLRDPAVRRRLLPPHPRRLDAQLGPASSPRSCARWSSSEASCRASNRSSASQG